MNKDRMVILSCLAQCQTFAINGDIRLVLQKVLSHSLLFFFFLNYRIAKTDNKTWNSGSHPRLSPSALKIMAVCLSTASAGAERTEKMHEQILEFLSSFIFSLSLTRGKILRFAKFRIQRNSFLFAYLVLNYNFLDFESTFYVKCCKCPCGNCLQTNAPILPNISIFGKQRLDCSTIISF